MLGRSHLKWAVKHCAGRLATWIPASAQTSDETCACILVYHRLASVERIDPQRDDWNVHPSIFARQIAGLAGHVEFASLLHLPQRRRDRAPSTKPLVCITFDDGYANFLQGALPVLREYNVPATVFVVTGFVGSKWPMPFDAWASHNRTWAPPEAWRPMNWNELESCSNSGLVTVGAHSHRHLDGRSSSCAELNDEAAMSRDILRRRLGEQAGSTYAYPYGSSRLGHVPTEYVVAVKKAGYQCAVSTDVGLVSECSDRFRLPRVEAHGSDSAKVLWAKARGALLPYRVTDLMRYSRKGAR